MEKTITTTHTRDAKPAARSACRLGPAAGSALLGSRRALREIPVR